MFKKEPELKIKEEEEEDENVAIKPALKKRGTKEVNKQIIPSLNYDTDELEDVDKKKAPIKAAKKVKLNDD